MSDLFPHVLTIDASGAIVGPENVEADGKRVLVAGDPATFTDQQLRAVFQIIDDTQGLNFYMLADDPGKLADEWTARNRKDCIRCDGDGCDPEDWRGRADYFMDPDPCRDCYRRPNVIIGVHVTTQAEADRLIPELLKLSGLCHALWADLRGQTEEIDFSVIPISKDTTANVLSGVYTLTCDEGVDHPGAQQEYDGGPQISFVTIGGINKPIHPQWLRTIRDQCKAADVPVWFDGWGEWMAFDQVRTNDQRDAFSQATIRGEQSYFGACVAMGPQGLKTSTTPGVEPVSYAKVGSTRSGHLLDGVELRQTIEGE